jgi:hypothetical protein
MIFVSIYKAEHFQFLKKCSILHLHISYFFITFPTLQSFRLYSFLIVSELHSLIFFKSNKITHKLSIDAYFLLINSTL